MAFIRERGFENIIGIGHSMGAHAMIDAAAATVAFSRLLLLDPTVPSPEAFADSPLPDFSQQHPAAKRKNHFDSPEDMRDRLLPKGAYRLFEPRVLMDYCRYGLVPADDGGMVLACHPEMEASVYQTARTNAGAIVTRIGISWKVKRQAKKSPMANSATWRTVALNWSPQNGQISSRREAAR